MNREEEANRAALRGQLYRLARTLPVQLNDPPQRTWRSLTDEIDRTHPSLVLARNDGMTITITQEWLRPDRLQVTGGAPVGGPYWERSDLDTGSTTVTRAKGPLQIAADIRRRLLPKLDAAATEVGERQARHAATVAHVGRAVQMLAALPRVTGTTVTADQRRNGCDAQRSLRWNGGPSWPAPTAAVKITHRDGRTRVHLEAQNLTPEMARAALTALEAAYRNQLAARTPPNP